MILPTAFQYRM